MEGGKSKDIDYTKPSISMQFHSMDYGLWTMDYGLWTVSAL